LSLAVMSMSKNLTTRLIKYRRSSENSSKALCAKCIFLNLNHLTLYVGEASHRTEAYAAEVLFQATLCVWMALNCDQPCPSSHTTEYHRSCFSKHANQLCKLVGFQGSRKRIPQYLIRGLFDSVLCIPPTRSTPSLVTFHLTSFHKCCI
jgi:hypothetical protein